MKGFIGSANIDTNSRLCMASSVAGHVRAFGEDVVPGVYEDWEEADLVVLVGSNAAWCHPVLHQRLLAARAARGTKIVVIDPRRTATAEAADLHLPLAAGADVALRSEDAVAERLRPAALVIDCVGSDATLALAGEIVSPGGHVSILGMAGGTFPMRRGGVPMETTVVISNWGTRAELAEVVALARAGTIALEVEPVALADVVEAYARLERGDVRGRVVAVP
jgi:D-arabinose 1-dehydrogenase-like Zn-dependent alcohol dehydrogenase